MELTANLSDQLHNVFAGIDTKTIFLIMQKQNKFIVEKQGLQNANARCSSLFLYLALRISNAYASIRIYSTIQMVNVAVSTMDSAEMAARVSHPHIIADVE